MWREVTARGPAVAVTGFAHMLPIAALAHGMRTWKHSPCLPDVLQPLWHLWILFFFVLEKAFSVSPSLAGEGEPSWNPHLALWPWPAPSHGDSDQVS